MNCKLLTLVAKVVFGAFYLELLFLASHSAYAAEEFKKLPYPIFSPGSNYWDSYHVQNPTIFKRDLVYQMWFEANGGPGKRIGFATSQDGISNWSRNSAPSISVGSLDGWEKETAEPFVLYEPTKGYEMWYSSFNSDHWTSGNDRFRLQYATSSANTTWAKYPNWSLHGTVGGWDSGGIYKGKSILFLGGKYHLWYGGTNDGPLGSNAYWRIGYATSSDGIHWEKQNQGNPVIIPGESELKNSSYPALLYFRSIYHMFYGAGDHDDPTQIYYAYSYDGINWTRPNGINPVLTTGPNQFDALNIAPFTVLKEDDLLRLWYSAYGIDGHWKIGYATASASILVTPEPTISENPTPSPTPIVNKVVVIPGMGAGWNPVSMLSCGLLDGGEWTLNPIARPYYDPLLIQLSKVFVTAKIYSYDWRKPIPTNGKLISDYINSIIGNFEKITIVGHSMGGLIARAYIEELKQTNKIDKLITVGSPHEGAPEAYYLWQGGDYPKNDLMLRFALTFIEKQCGGLGGNKVQTIQKYIPSIHNLLPIGPYLRDVSTATLNNVTYESNNNWLPTSAFPPYFGVIVGTLSGRGFTTTENILVKKPSKHDVALQQWVGGKPFKNEETIEGDGTILTASGFLKEATSNEVIEQTHTGLITSKEGMDKILSFLGFQNISTLQNHALPSSALVVIAHPSSTWVFDPSAHVLKDQNGILVLLNPKKGSYRLTIAPNSSNTQIIIGQFLKNGSTLWKRYDLKGILPKFKTIKFDPDNPIEDALQ